MLRDSSDDEVEVGDNNEGGLTGQQPVSLIQH
jgi:hypothetical protein